MLTSVLNVDEHLPSHTANSSNQGIGDSYTLPVRSSCNFCRTKKVKCDKTSPEHGGCLRCRREGLDCCYDVRDPIGRPRKRKVPASLSPRTSSASPMSLSGMKGPHHIPLPKLSSSASSMRNDPRSLRENARQQSPNNKRWIPQTTHHDYKYGRRPDSISSRETDSHSLHSYRPSSPTASTSSVTAMTSPGQTTPSSCTSRDTLLVTDDGPATTANLSDLGLAAFLESLDTLEIAPEDGLTPSMLQTMTTAASSTNSTMAFSGEGCGGLPTYDLNSALTLAGIGGSTSYAVPADLSWADPTWLFKSEQQSAISNASTSGITPKQRVAKDNHVFGSPTSWPRGAASGMGQGELRSLDGQLVHPSPFPVQRFSPSTINQSLVENEVSPQVLVGCPKEGPTKSCCCSSSKTDVTPASPANKVSSEPIRKEIGVGSGCGKDNSAHSAMSPPQEQTRVHCVPNPTGKGCTCLCDVSIALINVRTTLRQARGDDNIDASRSTAGRDAFAEPQSDRSTIVAGKRAASTLQLTLSASQAVAAQCACSASCPTCRSDPSTSLSASLLVSTALQIYIRAVRTLRQGLGAAETSGNGDGGVATGLAGGIEGAGSVWDVSIGQYRPKAANARRIALFAMKLELRDLRDAIAKISRAACYSSTTETDGSGGSTGGNNAAGTVASGASHESAGSIPSTDSGVNPIDRVLIRKLHQQLGDLLHAVEGIEEQQDAERAAHTLSAA